MARLTALVFWLRRRAATPQPVPPTQTVLQAALAASARRGRRVGRRRLIGRWMRWGLRHRVAPVALPALLGLVTLLALNPAWQSALTAQALALAGHTQQIAEQAQQALGRLPAQLGFGAAEPPTAQQKTAGPPPAAEAAQLKPSLTLDHPAAPDDAPRSLPPDSPPPTPQATPPAAQPAATQSTPFHIQPDHWLHSKEP